MNTQLTIGRLQTDNLGITLAPKIASTNLKKFFTKQGRTLLYRMRHNTTLRVGQKNDFTNQMPKYLIVLTKSERRRWCSGVLEEVSSYTDKESLISILDKEADRICSEESYYVPCIFHNKYSHLGTNDYQRHLTQLLFREHTYFCDVDKLNEPTFWEWVCELDPTWPKTEEWIWDWQDFQNGIYGPPSTDSHGNENTKHLERDVFVDVIQDMLNNDKRLSLIKDILETNQRSIDYIKTTDIWFDTVGDKIVWGDELPKLAS